MDVALLVVAFGQGWGAVLWWRRRQVQSSLLRANPAPPGECTCGETVKPLAGISRSVSFCSSVVIPLHDLSMAYTTRVACSCRMRRSACILHLWFLLLPVDAKIRCFSRDDPRHRLICTESLSLTIGWRRVPDVIRSPAHQRIGRWSCGSVTPFPKSLVIRLCVQRRSIRPGHIHFRYRHF